MSRRVIVSVHDVAPPSQAQVDAMLDRLAAIGVSRRSLLVIPNARGQHPIDERPAFCEWLRFQQAAGDEIVMHGYEHVGVETPRTLLDRVRNRWFTDGEGEFLSLGYADAAARLQLGDTLLRRAGFDACGFVAPAWLISRAGLSAVRDLGFAYTNSYPGVVDLQHQQWHFAPSVVFGPGRLNEDLGVMVQRRLVPLLRRCPTIRIVLHPPCVDHPRRLATILEIAASLVAGREVTTYAQLLEQYRTESAQGASHAS